ncbi:MAG: insulinase family protein [Kofleriaceae bacterium]|nr:insulinase family protein [Kofleriaceae bacterium]
MSKIRSYLFSSLLLPAVLLACGPKTTMEVPSSKATAVNRTEEGPGDKQSQRAAVELIPNALPGDPMAATVHRLTNGLTVYISTDRSTPSISSWIVVRSGSRHDPKNSTGLAHYLEHMLFKGSSALGSLDFAKEKPHLDNIAKLYDELRDAADDNARNAILAKIDKETQASSQYSIPNEFDNLYASLGIDGVNAFTGNDQTVYIASVPSNQFETWTKVEGDRFSNPQFRLFYPELESVYEEKNRSLDNPNSRIDEAVARGLFPAHPYGTQPTLGSAEHLKTPAFGDMAEFFDTWYRPNNMAIVLAGDIDAKTALPALQAAFGAMAPKDLPALPESSLTPPSARQDIEIVAPGEQSVLIAWPTVAVGHPDKIVLDAMDLVIDNSATGLLNLELVLSQKLPQAGSYGYVMREAGMWVLNGTARDGQSHEDVETLLMSVVAKLKAGAFTQKDLDAIVINREISDKRSLESNGARVSKMANSFINDRNWSDVIKDQGRLRAVTREEVMRVANTYLTDAPLVANRKRGEFKAEKVNKPSITPIKIDSSKESAFANKIKAIPVDALSPQWLVQGEHFSRSELPAGPLISVVNERNDLFTLEYLFKSGRSDQPLLCHAFSLLERSGAGQRAPKDLQKRLYSIGSSIEFRCGVRSSTIVLAGIDRKMEDTIAILKEWVSTPLIEDGTLSNLVANALSQRKDAMNEPSVIAAALSQYALRGKNSVYLNVVSNKSLKRAKEKTLMGLITRLVNTKHRTAYFGPRNADRVKAVVGLGTKHKVAAKQKPLRYKAPKKSTLYFVDQKVAQAQIRIGWPTGELTEADSVKAALFNQYVGGGMGGLIFQEIREARGLAYSAWTYHTSSDRRGDDSLVVAGLGTQADKSVEAVRTLMSLLIPLRVEPGRFTTAKNSLDADYRKNRTSPRRRSDVVFAWEDRGLSEDPSIKEYAELHKTPAGDMQTFANSKTKTPPILSISGDSDRIDLKALAAAIGIKSTKILKVSQLFGW